jgi:hypothetical protein
VLKFDEQKQPGVLSLRMAWTLLHEDHDAWETQPVFTGANLLYRKMD